MSYCKKTVKAGSVIDVMEYHTARYGAPGQKREKKRKATPEQMAKAEELTALYQKTRYSKAEMTQTDAKRMKALVKGL